MGGRLTGWATKELGLATQECPEIDEISRELTKEIAKIAAPKRKLQDPLQDRKWFLNIK